MLSAIFNGLKIRRRPTTHARHAARSRRPQLESMEGKCLLSTVPLMIVDNVAVVEGTSENLNDTTPMTFTVSLTSPTSKEVTVNFRTINGSATGGASATTPGADYVTKSGVLTFKPGDTTQTFTINIVPDSEVELTEVFYVALSGAKNAQIIKSIGVGTIQDDDTQVDPELSINNVSMKRGLDGHKLMKFTVSLNTTVDSPVSVTAKTRNVTALAGIDYDAKTQTLTFAPGETTKQFTVKIYGTSKLTSDKLLYVGLTSSDVPLKVSTGVGILRYGA